MKNQSVHNVQYKEGTFELRPPQTREEWEAYHRIRIAEIQERYCTMHKYDYKDPEEKLKNNFRFVFIDSATTPAKVLGAIRVDLLDGTEASLRWVAIDAALQSKGHGRCMLALAEKFIKDHSRILIRVPAEEGSKGFYEKLGYILMDWPKGPHHPGEVSMGKHLYDR